VQVIVKALTAAMSYELFACATGRRKLSRSRGWVRLAVIALVGWLIGHLVVEFAAEDRLQRAAAA
jgi:hypothetical protein